MSSLASIMTSATLAPGQLEGQPLPSGSASALQTLDGSTGKAMQSFIVPSGPLKQPASWEGVPIWSADLALNSKPLPIPQKRTLDMPDLGALESQPLDKAQGQTYSSSQTQLSGGSRDASWSNNSQASYSSSQEASNTLATLSSSRQRGGKSAASTSLARQGQGKARSFTKHMATATFTLSQARGILGSTSMMANKFSSLTSIRTALNARRSLDGWMDILSKCKSREVTSLLDGVSSTSSRTTTGTSSGTQRYKGGSALVESSSSNGKGGSIRTSSGSSKENEIDLTETSSEEEEEDYSETTSDEEMINDEEEESDYECYGDYD